MNFISKLEKIADTLIQNNEINELIIIIQMILSPEISYREENTSIVHLKTKVKDNIIKESRKISETERSKVANDLYKYSIKYSSNINNNLMKNNLLKYSESMRKIATFRK
jgi:23S rRNA C2498 (ribose-2'-O)-methylase RlmM